jgi:hypothetical protein
LISVIKLGNIDHLTDIRVAKYAARVLYGDLEMHELGRSVA